MKLFSKNSIVAEGIRVGLKAFIIVYVLAFILAVVVNMSVIEELNDYLQGTLSSGVGFDFGVVIKVASLIMNISVFNTSGSVQLGILIVCVLPLSAFYIANMGDNKKEGMDLIGIIIYGIASMVFTTLLSIISIMTSGSLLNINIHFFSLRNFIMTFLITLLIQVAIGMNYNINRLPGIIGTRWMLRQSLGFTTLISMAGMVYVFFKYLEGSLEYIVGLLILLPNVAVYLLFLMMGISINYNDGLRMFLVSQGLHFSYELVPIPVRIILLIVLMVFVIVSLFRINKKMSIKGMVGFTLTYPLLCVLMAYGTTVDLGKVQVVGDINFGINYAQAFLYPFIGIMIIGTLFFTVKHLMGIIKA